MPRLLLIITQRALCIGLLCCMPIGDIWAQQKRRQRKNRTLTTAAPEPIKLAISQSTQQSVQQLSRTPARIEDQLRTMLSKNRQRFDSLITTLNQLREPSYQKRVAAIARRWEGKNVYHDYYIKDRNQNDDTNTCVNGWCQVMSETGIFPLAELTEGYIRYRPGTWQLEQRKPRPNLYQRKPKYVNVSKLLQHAEYYGFLPIDLDLTQRGDFSIQYYRKTRVVNEFTAQHISIVDEIVPLGDNGAFELRDWHEGVDDEPFIYRTGSSHKSSHNNLFSTENVYYGFQQEQGKERTLTGKNPNICQGYAYFGERVAEAKPIIAHINLVRGQIDLLQRLLTQYQALAQNKP